MTEVLCMRRYMSSDKMLAGFRRRRRNNHQWSDKNSANPLQSLDVLSRFAKGQKVSRHPVHFQGRGRRPIRSENRVDIFPDVFFDPDSSQPTSDNRLELHGRLLAISSGLPGLSGSLCRLQKGLLTVFAWGHHREADWQRLTRLHCCFLAMKTFLETYTTYFSSNNKRLWIISRKLKQLKVCLTFNCF